MCCHKGGGPFIQISCILSYLPLVFPFLAPTQSASSCRASIAAGRDDTLSQPHLKQNGISIHAFFDT